MIRPQTTIVRPELCPECTEIGIMVSCRQGEVRTIPGNQLIGKCNQWKGGCEYR